VAKNILDWYLWVAALGFPVAIPFMAANLERWKHITGWRRGYAAGYMRAWEEQVEELKKDAQLERLSVELEKTMKKLDLVENVKHG